MILLAEGQSDLINRAARNPSKLEEAEFDLREYATAQAWSTLSTK